ncbi:MAG: glycosyltransferase family 2 protein [Planctomycetia bacterium]|nr:glycosyltransferase family 2 protein [Planctomycetia bacterium]
MTPPVIIVVFNRPRHTARLLEQLAAVRPRQLLVVADGPRPAKPGEREQVAAVRGLVDRISWPCEVVRNESGVNMGCRARVASGLNWAFSLVEEAIILEDDISFDPTFVRYCEELLERYRDDPRVGSISATDYSAGSQPGPASYWFSRYNLFWGWATWRRAWKLYDDEMSCVSEAPPGGLDPILRKTFGLWRERTYWKSLMRRTHSGNRDSWGYRWLLSCWRHDMLGIQPCHSLADNHGFGAESTHTRSDPYRLAPARPMRFPLVHPTAVARNVAGDRAIEDRVYSKDVAHRLAWMVRKVLGR